MGYVFDVGPECEFFLFHTDDNGLPTTLTHEKGGYFDLGPIDLGENVRRDMILTLEDMGFEIEASHHEVAPAQHEIDFHYDEALITADNIMTFKLTVKTIAKDTVCMQPLCQNRNTASTVRACMSICPLQHWTAEIFLQMKMMNADSRKMRIILLQD